MVIGHLNQPGFGINSGPTTWALFQKAILTSFLLSLLTINLPMRIVMDKLPVCLWPRLGLTANLRRVAAAKTPVGGELHLIPIGGARKQHHLPERHTASKSPGASHRF